MGIAQQSRAVLKRAHRGQGGNMFDSPAPKGHRLNIAVIGTGIAGMSAAWLLNQGHNVTVYEKEPRPGGHSNTVDAPAAAGPIPVDTGFIVYNERTYPNLTALFDHLGVRTKDSDKEKEEIKKEKEIK